MYKKTTIILLSWLATLSLNAINATMKDEVITGSSSLLTGTKLSKNGDKIFYFGTDRKLYCADLSQTNYPVTCISDITVGGYVNAADNSDLVYDSYHVYYVGTNNKVVNYYYSGGVWYCGTLNGSSQNAIAGGAISVDNVGRLFYIGSDGKVYQFAWSGSWVATALPAGQLAATHSDLYAYNNHIFYVGSNNKIYNYYYSAGIWYNAILNTGAPLAQTGTSITQDEFDRVYYVATDNKIYHYTWTGSWNAASLSNTTAKSWASPKVQKYCGKVWYIDQTTNAAAFLFYSTTWTSNNVYANNSSTITNYSSANTSDILITDNGDLVYNSAADNKLHLLSPQINWKTVTIASGLSSIVNGNPGTETSLAITKRPFDYQFYPRNSSNIGTIPCEGNVWGYYDITWKIEKTNFSGVTSTYTVTTPVSINLSNGDFATSLSIYAELSEYKIFYKLGCQTKYTQLADKVVCGDAFIASGQSNIHAADGELNMCTINANFGATSTYGKYSRSFGDNITESRTWGIPSANNDITAYYDTHPIGALVLPLQYKLQQTFGIPTCFLNNALGGTSINAHQLHPTDKFYFEYLPNWNFNNIEGHLMRRVYASGLENNIKGFLWYQGESEVSNTYTTGLYKTKFKQLYDGLAAGIPSLSSSTVAKNTDVYMVQIHSFPWGFPYVNMVSEDIRTMASYIPYANVSVVSSNGAKYPNCSGIHFNEAGYEEIATRVYSEMKSGSFGATYNVADFPLNIVSATSYINTGKVSLTFNQPISAGMSDNLNNVLDAVYLSNSATKSNPVISGNSLVFNVSTLSGLTSVSYMGSLPGSCGGNYSPACPSLISPSSCIPGPQTSIATGWWCPSYLRNSAGIAALSFYNFPVSPEGQNSSRLFQGEEQGEIAGTTVQLFPNPASDEVTVQSPVLINKIYVWDVRGVLVTELYPNALNAIINTSQLASGIYNVQLISNGASKMKKLLINK